MTTKAVKTKKVRIVLFIILLLVVVYWLYSSGKNTKHCENLSGFHSYAWGGGSQECELANCRVEVTEYVNDPDIFDDEGYYFRCVSRKI
ncbi:hypothetical protein ACFL2C_00230 [Patescibacteria group bacterium]